MRHSVPAQQLGAMRCDRSSRCVRCRLAHRCDRLRGCGRDNVDDPDSIAGFVDTVAHFFDGLYGHLGYTIRLDVLAHPLVWAEFRRAGRQEIRFEPSCHAALLRTGKPVRADRLSRRGVPTQCASPLRPTALVLFLLRVATHRRTNLRRLTVVAMACTASSIVSGRPPCARHDLTATRGRASTGPLGSVAYCGTGREIDFFHPGHPQADTKNRARITFRTTKTVSVQRWKHRTREDSLRMWPSQVAPS